MMENDLKDMREKFMQPLSYGLNAFYSDSKLREDKAPTLNNPMSISAGIQGEVVETFVFQLEAVLFEVFGQAASLGLAVPATTVLYKHMPLYLVERYDRIIEESSGRIYRLHQEDFCQALAVMPDMKYEKEGGPTLQNCFQVLRDRSIQPTADIKSLLGWVVFNFLIGNADAHAKNISLLLTDRGPKLAPFYDLLCTAVYPELNAKMAMRVGGEVRPEWIIARRWEQFASDIGISYKLVKSTLKKMSQQMVEQAHGLKDAFFAEHGQCDIINKIITIIEKRARKVATILAEKN